jgi:ubiquinone/menaquinone biosynthesis C-methylase UbiE
MTSPREAFKSHPIFARLYIRGSEAGEKRGAAEHRRGLLAGLSGRVLELGCGNGLNFEHYPESVSEVVAVEPEPTMRGAAEQAARAARVEISVVDGVAEALPVDDESVDAAVASLVLCSVPDQDVALVELRRVIRPGGELRFYEHVIANRQPLRAFLRFLDGSRIWPTLAAGCHPARDTGAAIEAAGFTIERCERFGFAAGPMQPQIPHILGTARR